MEIFFCPVLVVKYYIFIFAAKILTNEVVLEAFLVMRRLDRLGNSRLLAENYRKLFVFVVTIL
jgi:hypothetical protein